MSANNTVSIDGEHELLIVSRPEEGVLLVKLNRPKALNALRTSLFTELNGVLFAADKDESIKSIVLTGSERAFAGKLQGSLQGTRILMRA